MVVPTSPLPVNNTGESWHETFKKLVSKIGSSVAADGQSGSPGNYRLPDIEKGKSEECYLSFVQTHQRLYPLSKSEQEWYSTVLKSGTVKDKTSTFLMRVRSAPFYGLSEIRHLMTMARKKGRGEALMGIEALKEVWLLLLPKEDRLRGWRGMSFPFTLNTVAGSDRDALLALVYFEDTLKGIFFEFIQLLEALSLDPLYHVRYRVCHVLFDLLNNLAEQEQNMLTLLINKLGDPDNKISSRVAYLLNQILAQHPGMAIFFVKECEELMLRRKKDDFQAQYYGLIFLNQIVLTKKNPELASHLVHLYLKFFNRIIQLETAAPEATAPEKRKKKARHNKSGKGGKQATKKDVVETAAHSHHEKLLSALLTGLNRAFPFAAKVFLENEGGEALLNEKMDSLFSLLHNSRIFSTSIQALQLLFTLVQHRDGPLRMRFLRSLYALLFDSRLVAGTKGVAIFLNIVYKSLVSEISNSSLVSAFIKRLLQLFCYSSAGTVPVVCAGLILISRLIREQPNLLKLTDDKQTSLGAFDYDDDDDGLEHFVDADMPQAQLPVKENKKTEIAEDNQYDPLKRDPGYSNAGRISLRELDLLCNHYHPTVSFFAREIKEGNFALDQNNAVDPFESFSLINFLDRFVLKNARQTSGKLSTSLSASASGSGSVMQPTRKRLSFIGSLVKSPQELEQRNQNLLNRLKSSKKDALKSDQCDISPDRLFFYQYLMVAPEAKKASGSNKLKKNDDLELGKADEAGELDKDFEDEVDQYMAELGGGDDDEDEDEDEDEDIDVDYSDEDEIDEEVENDDENEDVDDEEVDEEMDDEAVNGSDEDIEDSEDEGDLDLLLSDAEEEEEKEKPQKKKATSRKGSKLPEWVSNDSEFMDADTFAALYTSNNKRTISPTSSNSKHHTAKKKARK